MSNNSVPNSETNKRKKKVLTKQEKYQKLLQKVDIKLDIEDAPQQGLAEQLKKKKKSSKSAPKQDQQNQEIQLSYKQNDDDIDLQDLLGQIEAEAPESIDDLQKHYEYLSQQGKLMDEPLSKNAQDMEQRKQSFKYVKTDMQKWIPLVKKNRQAVNLDFSKTKTVPLKTVNTLSSSEIRKNPIAKAMETKLKELNLESEAQVKEGERELIENMDPSQAAKNMAQMLKEKNMRFYKEQKSKRIAKIKSKLYHKIKKRQKEKEVIKKIQNLDQDARKEEINKLQSERIRERLSLRHKTQSQTMKNLLRYGEKKSVQDTINEVNRIHRELVKKINDPTEQFSDDDGEYDDQKFREQAIKDLEQVLLENEEESQDKTTTGLPFLDKAQKTQDQKAKQEAYRLLRKLKANQNIEDDFDEEIQEEDDKLQNQEAEIDNEFFEPQEGFQQGQQYVGQKRKAKNQLKKQDLQTEDFEGRKIFKAEIDDKKEIEQKLGFKLDGTNVQTQKKSENIGKVLNQYISKNNSDEKETTVIEEIKNVKQAVETQSKTALKNDKDQTSNTIQQKDILEGINIQNLKKKYTKDLESTFTANDIKAFSIENKSQIYEDMKNYNVLVDNQNEEEFLKEKFADYQQEMPKEQSILKGWGSWAGHGIKEKAPPTQEEIMVKKIKLIEQLKNKRKDGTLDNVIIKQSRNQLVQDYLVKKLPYPFNNSEQFNFMNNTPLGSEWNTMRTHHNIIQPKIKTKSGIIIQPSELPQQQI